MTYDLRSSIANRIEEINTPKAKAFARFIRGEGDVKRLPCWADIVERFEEQMTDDDDREAIWKAFVAEGNSRPLLLFLYSCADRPELRQRIRDDVSDLPVNIQRAFASMEAPDTALDRFHHSASRMDENRHRLERSLFAGEVGALLVNRYNRPSEENSSHMRKLLKQIHLDTTNDEKEKGNER